MHTASMWTWRVLTSTQTTVVLVSLFSFASCACEMGDIEVSSIRDLERLAQTTCITGSLNVIETEDVTVLRLPELTSIGGYFSVEHNSALSAIDAPRLESVGGAVRLYDNNRLENLSGLGALREVEGLSISLNDVLVEVNLDLLKRDGDFFTISGNSSLRGLDLPTLTRVDGTFNIFGNPVLPTCLATALRDRLVAAGFSGEELIEDNEASSSTCP